MQKLYQFRKYFILLIFLGQQGFSQVIKYSDTWGDQGITMVSSDRSGFQLNCSLKEFQFEEVIVDGASMNAIHTSAVFLPNESGAPDLPVMSRYIVIPNGARASAKIISSRTELYRDIDAAPAPSIPLDTDPSPLQYQKNQEIYSKDAFYPENPVMLSEPTKIRGVDAVMIGITPFQYNPVTRELIVYRDLKVEIVLEGGNGKVGDDRLRSRWWDPVVRGAVLNPDAIPEITWQSNHSANRTPDYEYLIITPDSSIFLQWADSIKIWRTLQGISTGVVTTAELGGNSYTAIKTYVDNAYNTWDVPPVAVLLLGDYSTGTNGIDSYLYTHPAGVPAFASDNYYADVDGNDLPDIVFARITARTAAELQIMVTKFLNYERNPPTDPEFYDKPVTALGWQTTRWFQICSEVISGYLKNVQGKNPVRINALYAGDPTVDPWSTAINTSTVLNYFGPDGTGYIPATPQELGGFTGGTGTDIVNAINNGTYMVVHRDHGSYTSWGEPYFHVIHMNSLTNVNNELPFVFSVNCCTGAFHRTTECFAEKFHRKAFNGQNSGALGLIAATEVSYSYVNDTYIWGVFDNMFPDFMPSYSTQFPTSFTLPAFANAAGKYFLYQSGWPYNTMSKQVTYRLFHDHGDAFTTIYTEVPQALTVSHASTMVGGVSSFSVTANTGSSIALTVNSQIIAVATGTGNPLSISIPPQNGGQTMVVTVTKQNYFRYSSGVQITNGAIAANFSANPTSTCAGQAVTFTDLSVGSPTSWNWSFPGGNPSAYQGHTPPGIVYNTAGSYNVTLTVSNANSTDTETKTAYITVVPLNATFSGTPTALQAGQSVVFTDNSTCNPSSWHWSFPGGNPSTFTGQNPPAILYNTAGTYNVSLTVSNGSGSDIQTNSAYIVVTPPVAPPPVADFSATPTNIGIGQSVQFTDLSTNNPTTWNWSFPGGTPASSNLQNPAVTYASSGSFDVTLTVTDADAGDTEIKTDYISVDPAPVYCEPFNINNQQDYINSIMIGTVGNTTGKGSSGFIHYSAPVFNFTSGQSYSVTLSPGSSSNRYFWRIWIDSNSDGDFTDAGEILLTANNKKGTVNAAITIPAAASESTRLRISMRKASSQAPCDDNFNGEVEDYDVILNAEDGVMPVGTAGLTLLAYPNPAEDQINVHVTGNSGPVMVRIFSSQGLLIKSVLLTENYDRIDLAGYLAGIYFIIAEDGRQQAVDKIILK